MAGEGVCEEMGWKKKRGKDVWIEMLGAWLKRDWPD